MIPEHHFSETNSTDFRVCSPVRNTNSIMAIVIQFTFLFVATSLSQVHLFELDRCYLSADLTKEIQAYEPVVNKIIGLVVRGRMKGQVFNSLAEFVDRFGGRLAGSEVLERSIDYVVKKSRDQELNVHTQEVTVPHWVRGEESATLIFPRKKKLVIVGLGKSVGTPPEGITAPVLVVVSFDELRLRAQEVRGKIIVFAQKFEGYHRTVKYRHRGASEAAKLGAVAVLIRSLAPHSLQTPHAGNLRYENNVRKIPAASISIEDSSFLLRMQKRGEKCIVSLKMGAKTFADTKSRNVIVDAKGREKPKEYVLVSGHIDSWDIGDGALDDGGGMAISWFVPIVLKALGLQPRRTVRAVLFTSEEVGYQGARKYKKDHDDKEIVLAMESDEGVFTPNGLEMRGSKDALCIVQEVLKLLKPINATILEPRQSVGSDIKVWDKTEVPTAAIRTNNKKYFWYHHTAADTISALNSKDMDKCLALWSAVSYIIADLRERLPRNGRPTTPKQQETTPTKPRSINLIKNAARATRYFG